MKRHLTAFSTFTLAVAALAFSALAQAQSVAGEVMKIDKAQQKITLKHEEIKKLDMPAMTMAYRVQDAGVLDQFKVGDRVRFEADKVNGQYTVTRLAPAN